MTNLVVDVCLLYSWHPRVLASILNVAPATVTRWASGKFPPTGLADDVLTALRSAANELMPAERERLGLELRLGLGAFLAKRLIEAAVSR